MSFFPHWGVWLLLSEGPSIWWPIGSMSCLPLSGWPCLLPSLSSLTAGCSTQQAAAPKNISACQGNCSILWKHHEPACGVAGPAFHRASVAFGLLWKHFTTFLAFTRSSDTLSTFRDFCEARFSVCAMHRACGSISAPTPASIMFFALSVTNAWFLSTMFHSCNRTARLFPMWASLNTLVCRTWFCKTHLSSM